MIGAPGSLQDNATSLERVEGSLVAERFSELTSGTFCQFRVAGAQTHQDLVPGPRNPARITGAAGGHEFALIQAAKARARGYRSKSQDDHHYLLIAGKLPNPAPYVAHPI